MIKIAEKGLPASEVAERLLIALGEGTKIETQIRTDGSTTPVSTPNLWLLTSGRDMFVKTIDALFQLDTPHFHIISGFDNGEFVTLRYHFSLYSYAGRNERVPVSVVVDVPKNDLVMPSLFDKIPGSEYSEREIREMLGVDFDGLPNKALVFLPDKWDEDIKPWRDDETGLASHAGSVRRLS